MYWLGKIREFKIGGGDALDHNKLRTYRLFKASFKREPYIDLIRNRNQRSFLTRLRVGAHTLAVELGRRTRPITPIAKRVCTFYQRSADCVIPNQTDIGNSGSDIIDDEFHFLIACSRFNNTRRTFYSAIAAIIPDFKKMDDDKKFLTLLCPTNPKTVKIANRYIKFMFDQRNKITNGENTYCL